MNTTTGRQRGLLSGGAYAALFLAGVVEGLIGSFQYSRMVGPVPLTAIACCVVLLATCLLGAWGMGSVGGALLPAIGWIVAAFVISMPDSSGSVIITNTAAGKWFLYGGAVSALIGVFGSLRTRGQRSLRGVVKRGR